MSRHFLIGILLAVCVTLFIGADEFTRPGGSGSGGGTASDVSCSDCVALTTETSGDYVSGVTSNQGLLKTGNEGASLGLIDCAATEVLKRNAGDTAWECAADSTGGGSSAFIGAYAFVGGAGQSITNNTLLQITNNS